MTHGRLFQLLTELRQDPHHDLFNKVEATKQLDGILVYAPRMLTIPCPHLDLDQTRLDHGPGQWGFTGLEQHRPDFSSGTTY